MGKGKTLQLQLHGKVSERLVKKIIATELANAIIATTPNIVVSHFVYQPARVVVDNLAICSGIASPTKAACSFTINIHG